MNVVVGQPETKHPDRLAEVLLQVVDDRQRAAFQGK